MGQVFQIHQLQQFDNWPRRTTKFQTFNGCCYSLAVSPVVCHFATAVQNDFIQCAGPYIKSSDNLFFLQRCSTNQSSGSSSTVQSAALIPKPKFQSASHVTSLIKKDNVRMWSVTLLRRLSPIPERAFELARVAASHSELVHQGGETVQCESIFGLKMDYLRCNKTEGFGDSTGLCLGSSSSS